MEPSRRLFFISLGAADFVTYDQGEQFFPTLFCQANGINNKFIQYYHFVQVLPQAAQARCINYREFRYCFAYYERFEEFVWEIHYSCRNTGMNIEINCTFVNLGLLLPFRCNLGSIHGRFIRFTARCLFGVVFLRKAKQGRWLHRWPKLGA